MTRINAPLIPNSAPLSGNASRIPNDSDMLQLVSFGDLLKVEAEKAQGEFRIQNDEFRKMNAEGVIQTDETVLVEATPMEEEEHELEEEELLEAGGEMDFSENLSEMQQEAQLESQFEMQTDEGRGQHIQHSMEKGNPLENQGEEGSPDVFRNVQSNVREVRTVERGGRNIFSAALETGEDTKTFREVESAFSPFEKQREEVGGHADGADGEMDVSALKAFEMPAQIQNEETKTRDMGGDADVNIKPMEAGMEMRGGGDEGQTFDGSGGNADSFSAEGLGQVTELHVEESSVEPNFVVAEPEKGSVSDAVDEAATGQPKSESIELIEQIISQVKPRFKNGETSMRLKLVPEDLGAIEIQMTSNERGVSLHFVTEQAATAQSLEAQSGQLRQSLKDAGFQLTDLNISQQNQPGQKGGFFNQERPFAQAHAPPRSIPQVGMPKAEGTRPQRMFDSPHEIDYLV